MIRNSRVQDFLGVLATASISSCVCMSQICIAQAAPLRGITPIIVTPTSVTSRAATPLAKTLSAVTPLPATPLAAAPIAATPTPVITIATTPAAFGSPKHPILQVPENTYTFGAVPQGSKITHEFELRNVGSADLQLLKITASCGCTATSIAAMVVKSGEIGKLKVEFDTAGFSGDKMKTVEVLTSDTASPSVQFSLKGSVLQGATTEPRRLEFGEIFAGGDNANWSREFLVNIADGSDLKIAKVQSFAKFLTVTELEKTAKGGRYKVEISRDTPRGELRDRISVDFEGGHQQALNIPLIASLKGDLRLSPSTLSFGVIEGTQPLEKRIRFENFSTKLVKVTSIKSSDPAVSASLVDVSPGKKAFIVVRVDPTLVRGDLRTTLELETDHPTENKLSVNVFAVQPPK